MNHLPVPLDGRRVSVPFFSRFKVFKPDDFFKIPGQSEYQCHDESHGQILGICSLDRLVEEGLCKHMEESQARAFLQDWLWFSLLACVTDQEIDSKDFYDPDGHSIETDPILNKTLKKWIEREADRATLRESSGNTCVYPQPQSLRASSALQIAQIFILKHLSYSARDTDGYHHATSSGAEPQEHWIFRLVDSRLSLSIAILGQTLQRERKWEPALDYSSHGHQLEELSHWGSSVFCRKQMMENNWCPREIRRVESTMGGPCEVYYASFFMRPDGAKENHEDCTIWHCTNVRKAPPSALHMEECPNKACPKFTAATHEQDVVNILDKGQTPLITFTRGFRGLVIKGYDLRDTTDYVRFGALSHSWGDSLVDAGRDVRGSNDRTMLKCQLQQLQKNFNHVLGENHENIPFWIDVLCLPRQEKSKRLALEQMHNIYKKAGGVIVWDKALLCRRKQDNDAAIEMNVRLRLGDWSRRLWTCLEVVLAKKIWIGFSDGLLSVADIWEKKNQAREDLLHRYHHIWEAGNPLSKPLWKLRCLHWEGSPDHDVMAEPTVTSRLTKSRQSQSLVLRAWSAVQFRDLEMSLDEPVVLASLLGLDVKKIMGSGDIEDKSRTAAHRMARLLEQIDITPGLGIPAGIIFLPPPFLVMEDVAEVRGYGWAPMTWIRRQTHPFPMYPSLSKTAFLGKRGLCVTFPALELHINDAGWRPHTTRFWVPVKRNLTVWYKVQLQRKEEDCKRFWEDNVCSDANVHSRHPCIMLSNDDPQGFNDIGLLVKPKGHLCDGRVRMVKPLCRVKVRQEQNPDTVGRLMDTFRKNEQEFIFGECTDKQEWCVVGTTH